MHKVSFFWYIDLHIFGIFVAYIIVDCKKISRQTVALDVQIVLNLVMGSTYIWYFRLKDYNGL